FEKGVSKLFGLIYRNQKKSVLIAFAVMVVCFFSFQFLGTEFLPDLNEGALWVEAELPMSVSLSEANTISNKMIDILARFPEVKQTLSQVGRTNDGTDPKGFFNVHIQVDLKPKKQWERNITGEQLI